MTDWQLYLLSYLLGSIPFGLLLTRAAGLGDIRKVGSGNIGATNVMRTGRKGLGVATLLLDAGKSAAAVIIARVLGETPETVLLCGLIAMLGHMFPIWLRFKGGKGVASVLGVYLAFYLPLGLATIAIWLTAFKLTRFSSLAALISIGVSPILGAILFTPEIAFLLLITALLIAFRHRGNIVRLLRKEEHAFVSTQKEETRRVAD